jgi:hypothetical protein
MLKTLVTGVVLGLTVTLGAAPHAVGGTQSASTLTNQASRTEITYGVLVTLSTDLTANSAPLANATVTLKARQYPATTFSDVTSLQTNAQGEASFAVKPAKRTDYKWVFGGNEVATGSESAWQTVKVHTKVNMHLRDSTISAGQRAVLVGSTMPPKPGATATVYRTTIGGATSKWFTGTVASDGTFRLSKRVPGTLKYRVYVAVARHSGNLRGVSATRDLWVSP